MRNLKSIAVLCIVAVLVSCKPPLPDGVLSESKMERVLYDFHLSQGMVEYAPRAEGQDYDAVRFELQQAVFRKHGITQEDFDRSMSYYLSDMDHLAKMYKRVADRLERDAEALGVAAGPRDAYAALTAEGDTANVWADRRIFVVRNAQQSNFQMWKLPCDSTWLPGDDLLWRFELKQITQSYGPGDLFADLVIYFTNDSVVSRLVSVGDKKDVELRIDNPDRLLPRSVSGHLFTPVETDPTRARMYVIYAPALIRFHKEQSDLAADSLAADSLLADSLRFRTDTLQQRLTPEQRRERQDVERTIDVVREKPYQAPRRGGKKRFTQPRRR